MSWFRGLSHSFSFCHLLFRHIISYFKLISDFDIPWSSYWIDYIRQSYSQLYGASEHLQWKTNITHELYITLEIFKSLASFPLPIKVTWQNLTIFLDTLPLFIGICLIYQRTHVTSLLGVKPKFFQTECPIDDWR